MYIFVNIKICTDLNVLIIWESTVKMFTTLDLEDLFYVHRSIFHKCLEISKSTKINIHSNLVYVNSLNIYVDMSTF